MYICMCAACPPADGCPQRARVFPAPPLVGSLTGDSRKSYLGLSGTTSCQEFDPGVA